MQGLVDAANDHVQTVRVFLANLDTDVNTTAPHANTTAGANAGTAAHRSSTVATLAADTPTLQQSAGSSQRTTPRESGGGGGRGNGKDNGKGKNGRCSAKLADRGCTAEELEDLIADVLARSGLISESELIDEGGAPREATVEGVAARLVKELGHRRWVWSAVVW